jgi:signal transduction histidine kinase
MEGLKEVEIYILLFGGIGVTLFLAVGFVLSLVLYQRKIIFKNWQILQIQNAHQKDLLEATLESDEQARARIARDLHDEVGATLATAKLYLAQIKPSQTNAADLAQQANELVNQTIHHIRLISRDLSPVVLTNLGVAAAVHELASSINTANAIPLHCDCPDTLPRFEPMKELMLYRIIQELINNSLKHAQAQNLYLSLRCQDGKKLYLAYRDDGKGFSLEKANHIKGLGLKNIESRSDILGGKAIFTSKENEGVRFEVEFEIG